MYLSDVWRVLRQRWQVVVAAFTMVCLGCALVAALTRPSYVSNASVVLVPPTSVEDPQSNRFLGLGGLDQAVAVLQRSMLSEQTRDALQAAAPEAEYVAVTDPATSAPILNLTASGRESQVTAAMLDAMLRRTSQNLSDLQSELDTPREARIVALVLTRDNAPHVDQKPRLRAVGASAVALLTLAFFLVGLLDGLLSRRSTGRRPPPPPPPSSPGAKLKGTPMQSPSATATGPSGALVASPARSRREKPPLRRSSRDDGPSQRSADRTGV